MSVHKIFAQIFEGEVKNLTPVNDYPTSDYVTKASYGPEAFAVECSQYLCAIGDKYHDGNFWKVDEETGEEKLIPPVPTQEQQIVDLQRESIELTLTMAELIGGV